MPLDSDLANADAHLHVEFYTNERVKDRAGEPFVRIQVPGDKTQTYDQPVRESHKQRFPRQWLHYQANNSGAAIIGTPLATWQQERPDDLTDGQLSELLVLRFMTAEQVATATDAQLQRIGMGAVGLRLKAQAYLRGKNSAMASGELDEMRKQLAEQKEMIAQLLAKPTPGKPGRKPKAPVIEP